jgi:hypothetical protein
VISTRSSIRIQVAEIVFSQAGGEHRSHPPSAAAARVLLRAFFTSWNSPTNTETTNQIRREREEAALGGDLHRHVVQVRVGRLHGVRDAIARIHLLDLIGTDAEQRIVLHDRDAGFQHRDAIDAGQVLLRIQDRACAIEHALRCEEHRADGDDRNQGEQAQVLAEQQQRHADGDADPGAARQRQAERDEQRRHHERGPQASRRSIEQPRRRGADDEHQRARVGHPVRQRARRPAAEAVEVEHRVLDDADKGAGGADRQHDAQHGIGARAAREFVGDRHQHQQHQLLAIGEADLRIDREARGHQRQRGIRDERPEKCRGFEAFASRDVGHQPGQRRDGEQDLRGGDRQLHGGDDPDQRPEADLFESVARRHARC